MEPDTYRLIQQREDIWRFIRRNPQWYRYLTREPNRLSELELASKQYYGKTLPQRLEKTQQNIQMIRLLMEMAGSWND
ncbi:YlbE-like family protein [Gracilibacillus kekensis]|uniref:YlbE-like protein n=1 Tax=Gracilibacillus kekensis TaxID=1027249 RepID=A0A1M7MB87_9BACI|nr:YlbE-like family protein [Gracilibacillus kekensis]SHM87535.1 YlbE-like protein [Gracilibacillus kekensis]